MRLREAGDFLLTSNLVLAETAARLRYDAACAPRPRSGPGSRKPRLPRASPSAVFGLDADSTVLGFALEPQS